jgi:hypothetical protein
MIQVPFESLLRANSTPEQETFLRFVTNVFDIILITPKFYQGVITGSEFETYNAKKLYFAYDVQIMNATLHGETEGSVLFYNVANGLFYSAKNATAYWEVAGAKDEFLMNPIYLKNFYFSRLASTIYDSLIFNGYLITLR